MGLPQIHTRMRVTYIRVSLVYPIHQFNWLQLWHNKFINTISSKQKELQTEK